MYGTIEYPGNSVLRVTLFPTSAADPIESSQDENSDDDVVPDDSDAPVIHKTIHDVYAFDPLPPKIM